MKNISASICTLLAILGTTHTSAIEVSKHLTTTIDPTPLKRVEPKYPINAARNNRSGWAELSFIIEKDGSVSNVFASDTSGSKDFTSAAIKAVKKWQYTPAMENGKPIQQCVNTVQMNFTMGDAGTTGVSRRFRKKYNEANQALKAKDFAQVEVLLTEINRLKHRHLSENNFIHTLSAEYASAINDQDKQLSHLNQIRFFGNSSSENHQLKILNQRFSLAVHLNKFKLAFSIYKRLQKLDAAKQYMAQYDKIIAQVDTFIQSNKELVIQAKIIEKDFWFHQLVRNEFTLADVTGTLNKLDLRCANKRHVYTVENNNTWTIPKSWKNCSLYVYGDDNTHFKLVEHPMKS